MKTMLAHIVLNYDVKTEFEGQRPDDLRVGFVINSREAANRVC